MKRHIKLLGLRIARVLGLFALSRRITRDLPRILCYHGGCIGDESDFNPKLFIRTPTFFSRMEWIRNRGFTVVSLDNMSAALQRGEKSVPLSVALTFDDGWHSTASELLPVLARMNLPSTLYLCTEHFLEQWPVAAVALRYIFWKAPKKQIRLNGFHDDIDGDYDLGSTVVRDRLALAVRDALFADSPTEQSVCRDLEKFASCLGVSAEELALAQRRFAYVTPAELAQVPLNGCQVELHGHVHYYPVGEPQRFHDDLQMCARVIADAGLPTPHHYCYPSGGNDPAASGVLKQLGVVSATTCVPALVEVGATRNLHYLPRFLDGEDVDVLEFEAEMSGFIHLLRRLRVPTTYQT